jgi:thymidylate kinase
VLCGADGSGKSTAAEAAVQGLRGTFSLAKGRRFHWKPPVFSGRRHAGRGLVADPHSQPPRARLVSVLFFAAHWLEFFLGWPLRIRPATFRGGLVMIDRYYFDFFVDQLRYRLNVPRSWVRLGYRCLPKPDLILLLDAPAEVLQGRKQEVSLAETRRQRGAYLEVIRNLPNGRVIDAAQPAEAVAAEIIHVVLDFMAKRAGSNGEKT